MPDDRSNLVVQAFEALHPADGLTFRMVSDIPVSAGLGSSAAAIVAGLMAADHMYELDAPMFELAAEIEGHPDNVAAALYGGFVICARGRAAHRFEPKAGLEGVIVTPPDPVPTAEARAALPAEVPIDDAVHNIAHASLLVLGLSTRRPVPGGPRPGRPDPPAAPRAPLPALDGPGRARGRLRRGRRVDLRRRPDGPVLDPLGADRPRVRGAAARSGEDCDVRRVQFAPAART